jgi:hypothetical protein
VLSDIELGGHTIRRGDRALALLASANRDSSVFVEPDRINPDRPNQRALSFGGGPHFCVGFELARRVGAIAFEKLAGSCWAYASETGTKMEAGDHPAWADRTTRRALRMAQMMRVCSMCLLKRSWVTIVFDLGLSHVGFSAGVRATPSAWRDVGRLVEIFPQEMDGVRPPYVQRKLGRCSPGPNVIVFAPSRSAVDPWRPCRPASRC